jgi:hypothetical protein
MTTHIPVEDITITDFCIACGHYHFSPTYGEKHKQRHCTIEGCRCLARSFIGRSMRKKI